MIHACLPARHHFKVISHRGNYFGPYTGNFKLQENDPDALTHHVYPCEVDVWFKNGEWMLGHDCPETVIDGKWFKPDHDHPKSFIVHCKDVQTACIFQNHFSDVPHFSHDADDCVFVQPTGNVWVHPNVAHHLNGIYECGPSSKSTHEDVKESIQESTSLDKQETEESKNHSRFDESTLKNVIIVMPERNPQITCATMQRVHGICTDYPVMFETWNVCEHRNMLPCWKLWLEYAQHANEMVRRNRGILWTPEYGSMPERTTGDTTLSCIDPDPRKCIALWSNLIADEIFEKRLDFFFRELETAIPRTTYIPYSTTSATEAENKSMLEAPKTVGCLHFTWMQMVAFDEYSKLSQDDIVDIRRGWNRMLAGIPTHVKESEEPLRIQYAGIALTPTGIVALGYPIMMDWHPNQFRNHVRIHQPKLREPYLSHILHSTICRFTRPLTKVELNNMIRFMEVFQSFHFGSAILDGIHMGLGSWRMYMSEVETWHTWRSEKWSMPIQK